MWVKICGVTTVDDAVMVASAGADAVGLNFYEPSKRWVGINAGPDAVLRHAAAIRDAVADDIDVVGVFVNSSAREVAHIANHTQLTAVQFHGDEPPQLIAEFHQLCPAAHIIRAFRIGDAGTAAMDRHLTQLAELQVHLAGVLVDAFVAGAYGGTGHTVDADTVNAWSARSGKRQRLVLAGGLTADNVAAAAESVRPWGIDTASGVELSPGIKSSDQVRSFVSHVRETSAATSRVRLSDA